MSSVPDEICFEILLRVPAKSTYVCKCVCKSWFQIISNLNFAKMHLDIAKQTNNYSLMFQSNDKRTQIPSTLNSISLVSLLSLNEVESEIVEMVDYPFSCNTAPSLIMSTHEEICRRRSKTCQLNPLSSYSSFRFIGSCDGLVCLLCYGYVPAKTHIYICNPATKEYKGIPRLRHSHRFWLSFPMNNAFGYDCKARDYKLISIVKNTEEFPTTEILQVYTLGSDSWTSSQIVPYKFPMTKQIGILVNGAFHWFGKAREYNSPKLIVSMDISNEKFDEVQLPEELSLLENKHASMTMGVLEGCLCLVVLISAIRYEVWMMRDYKVQESWSQVYVIDDESITGAGYTLGVMWSFKNGQILLKYGDGLVIFDPKHSSGKEPKIFSTLRIHDGVSYVESLISLNSGTYARGNKTDGK